MALTDEGKDRGQLGVGVGSGGNDAVGQLVYVGVHAQQHGAPALGGVRGDGGQAHIGARALGHDAADHGRGGVAVEVTRAVDSNENDVLVMVRNKKPPEKVCIASPRFCGYIFQKKETCTPRI